MNKEYTEAKKSTIEKWEGVLQLCEAARTASTLRCTYCIVTGTGGGFCDSKCPANVLCMKDVHLDATYALNEAIHYVGNLLRAIRCIKEEDNGS